MGLLERADEVYEMYRDDGHLWGVPHTKYFDLPKYKQNLRVRKEYMGADGWRIVVKSYDTDVAVGWEDSSELLVTEWYSRTTSKHINYAAKELDMYIKKLY